MKKLFLSTVALVAIAFSVNAQSFMLGVKAGTIGTKIDGESFESGYKLSYQGGAFAEIDLLGKIGVQPELLFSQTSSKTVSGTSGSVLTSGLNANTAFTLSYLSIPVLLRYNFAKFFTLNVGPQYGILLNKSTDLKTNGENAFKSGDVSGVLGLQFHLSSLRVYGRYVIGLNNISDVSSSGSWKSQQLELGVGLKVL